MVTEGDDFPDENAETPHIRFLGEHALDERFRSHPANWQCPLLIQSMQSTFNTNSFNCLGNNYEII